MSRQASVFVTHTHPPPRRQALPDAPMLQMKRQTRTRLRICQGRGVWGRRLDRGHSSALRLPQHLAAESGRVLCADRPPGGLSPPPPAHRDTATRACCGRLPQSSRLPMEMPAPVLALVRGQALPAFLLCSTLLVIKMYVVAIITGQVRLRKKVCSPGAPTPPASPAPALLGNCRDGKLGRGVLRARM